MRLDHLLIIFLLVNITGCKTTSYYNTSNDMLETRCILHMQNGTKQEGKISILFETGHEASDFIEFTKNNVKEKILLDSINSYELNNNFYYPKIVDIDLNGNEKILFLKALTKESSRIQFYELYQKKKQASDANDLYYYFIAFTSRDLIRPLNIAGKKFIPNFNDKMSVFVQDCPQLSDKIKHKYKGYFLPLLSLGNEKKVDVFLRIINEYNSCK